MATNRFDILSTSTSGVSYVREKKGGVMRALTESELADFNDPPPCPACGEQFGCDHLNIAGEAMLSDAEIEKEVPAEWMRLARTEGLSRADLERLRSVECIDDVYRAAAGADLRTLELVLLLNGEQ
jgi:hypothetical protein